jgi:hypothetical protein
VAGIPNPRQERPSLPGARLRHARSRVPAQSAAQPLRRRAPAVARTPTSQAIRDGHDGTRKLTAPLDKHLLTLVLRRVRSLRDDRKDLHVLGCLAAAQQDQAAEHPGHEQVQQPDRHKPRSFPIYLPSANPGSGTMRRVMDRYRDRRPSMLAMVGSEIAAGVLIISPREVYSRSTGG